MNKLCQLEDSMYQREAVSGRHAGQLTLAKEGVQDSCTNVASTINVLLLPEVSAGLCRQYEMKHVGDLDPKDAHNPVAQLLLRQLQVHSAG